MWIQKVPGGGVRAVAYSLDGATLYTLDTSGWITAWEVATHTSHRFAYDARLVYTLRHLRALPDGQRLVAATSTPVVWDIATRKPLADVVPTERLVWEPTCVLADGRMYGYQHNHSSTISGWNLTAGKSEPDVAVPDGLWPTRYFDIAPDQRSAIVVSYGSKTILCDWDGASLRNPFTVIESAWLQEARFSPDGGTLVLGWGGATAILWDVATRKPRTKALQFFVDRRLAFNPVFPVFSAVNANGTLAIWRLDTGEQIRALDFALGTRVRCAAFSPDGLTCAVGGSNKQFAVFDVDV